jgi:hypothetical protein
MRSACLHPLVSDRNSLPEIWIVLAFDVYFLYFILAPERCLPWFQLLKGMEDVSYVHKDSTIDDR